MDRVTVVSQRAESPAVGSGRVESTAAGPIPLAAVHLYRRSCCHGVRTVPCGLPDDNAHTVDRLSQEPAEGGDIVGDMDPGPQGCCQRGDIRALGSGEEPFEPVRRRGAGLLKLGEFRNPAFV